MRTFERHEPVLAGGAVPTSPRDGWRAGELAAYADDMRRFARRRVRDEALAEDAVQDALVAALRALPSFQGDSSLKTWLLGILAHKIKDAFRSESRYVPLPDEYDPHAAGPRAVADWPGAAQPEDDTVREVSRRRFGESVGRAVAQLPASLRDVFLMQAIDGLATEEVCRRLGISEGNCWVRLHRARKILASSLAGHY